MEACQTLGDEIHWSPTRGCRQGLRFIALRGPELESEGPLIRLGAGIWTKSPIRIRLRLKIAGFGQGGSEECCLQFNTPQCLPNEAWMAEASLTSDL
mmetsp:Transcript_1213/g.2796  ORF Transcript_1213/g.2796 Transcript_1213/m.2796 type:complete len:97 (-) Transcript_1213:2295-2585(-)